MKVNQPRDRQELLLELPPVGDFDSAGCLRAHSGNVVEQIARGCLNLTELSISGKCEVNFDAMHGTTYVEIKSVRANNKSVVYDFRLKKEAATGEDVVYIFVEHNCRGAKSWTELYQGMSDTITRAFALTLAEVQELAKNQPLKNIREGHPYSGYNRVGYKDGYRNIPMRDIVSRTTLFNLSGECEIYQLPFKITLFMSHAANNLLQK